MFFCDELVGQIREAENLIGRLHCPKNCFTTTWQHNSSYGRCILEASTINLNPVGFGSIPPVVEPFHIFSQIIYFLVNEHLAIKVFPPLADSATMLPEIVPFKTAKAKKTMLP